MILVLIDRERASEIPPWDMVGEKRAIEWATLGSSFEGLSETSTFYSL